MPRKMRYARAMYAISLTSIPPRFPRLGAVLQSLLAQDPAPSQVLLCLPRAYRRFPGAVTSPALPDGVRLIWSEIDHGPATKVLPAARALTGTDTPLIYCDDDWIMPTDWAAKLLRAWDNRAAVAATGFNVDRLGRISCAGTGEVDIAQGFSGVLISPHWFAGPEITPPEAAWLVDDIWLSGHLARQNIPIRLAPDARDGMQPLADDINGLQDAMISGQTRDQANRACAALLHQRYGIWPPAD